MRFNNLTYQGKSQSRSTVPTSRRAIQLMERFEDLLQMSRRDSDARVGDGNNDEVLTITFDAHDHASIRRGKFDSVIDKLIQHPSDLLHISLDRRQILI